MNLTFSTLLNMFSYTYATNKMVCGDGVPLCGVLALQTGYGPNEYASIDPCVHGLWPETDSYGTSKCITPTDITNPTSLALCYNNGTNDNVHQLDFEQHEWEKHGLCSGTKNADDFFSQVCEMSTDPLSIMTISKQIGGDIYDISDALTNAGYEVFHIDLQYSQIYLSACAGPDALWKLSYNIDFPYVCGALSSPQAAG